jgi:predicted lipoprotein with Yx(FWY)xxD motif
MSSDRQTGHHHRRLSARWRFARAAAMLALLAAVLAPAAAPASARAHRRTHRRAAAPTLELVRSRRGVILATGAGQTVYMFTRDPRRGDRCVRIAGCTSVWPPLISRGRVTLGRGVRRGLLGTIALSGHRRQLTYAGHALYLYTGNIGRADTRYIGVHQFGGAWYALRANGALLR